MKALPTRFDRVFQSVNGVETWYQNKRRWLDQKLGTIRSKLSSWLPAFWLPFAGCVVATLVAGAHSLDDYDFNGNLVRGTWPHWGSWGLGIGVALLIASIFVTYLDGKACNEGWQKMCPQFELELKGNPLYARAELIMRALKDYQFHCDRYCELRHQVDEELVETDEATAERYYRFIERAHTVLERAIANFDAVAERVARAEKYATEHPDLKEASESAGLSLLLSELDGKVEEPRLPAPLLDPVKALQHEEDLTSIVAELQSHEVVNG